MSVADEIRRLRSIAAAVALDHLAWVEMTGADAKGWLQGQATQDIRRLTPDSGIDFCLCSPTGQLEAIGRVWERPERLIIAIDEACVGGLLRRVEELVIMEDVAARRLDGQVVAVQGPDAWRHELPGERLASDRTGAGGWEALVPGEDELGALPPVVSEEALTILEIEAGIPRFGVDSDARTLPPELGEAFDRRTISYAKGCYVGQEVLMRIHSRGHTNRTWAALLADEPLAAGQTIATPARADAGFVTRAASSHDFGPIAAAMLRNEAFLPGSAVTVDGRIRAEVRAMPLR